MKSTTDCNKYEDGLHRAKNGWLEYKVVEKIGDLYPICLY
jgi:hypothetical protein